MKNSQEVAALVLFQGPNNEGNSWNSSAGNNGQSKWLLPSSIPTHTPYFWEIHIAHPQQGCTDLHTYFNKKQAALGSLRNKMRFV